MQKASDGTRFFTVDDWEELIKENDECFPKILVRDLILSLLAVKPDKPIYGRIMLMKQIFLLFTETLEPRGIHCQDPKFVAYDFGPYSFTVMQVVEDLRFSGYISIEGRKGSRKEAFKLSKKGKISPNQFLKILSDDIIEEIRYRRIGWDQLGTDGILRYVYEYYPKMKENSKIKNRYKDVSWGIGIA
jgi:uncharacterized protein YwgA